MAVWKDCPGDSHTSVAWLDVNAGTAVEAVVKGAKSCLGDVSDSSSECDCRLPIQAVYEQAAACSVFDVPAFISSAATRIATECEGNKLRCKLFLIVACCFIAVAAHDDDDYVVCACVHVCVCVCMCVTRRSAEVEHDLPAV